MGILGSQLLDGTGLPTPLYLPSRVRVAEVRNKSRDISTQVQAKKFSPLNLPSVSGLPVVPASLFFSYNDAGRYGIYDPETYAKDKELPVRGTSGATRDRKSTSAIQFSLIKSENHKFSSSVSYHPIEKGSPISDHIQRDQRTGSFVGLVSNFSLLTAKTVDYSKGDRAQMGLPPQNLARDAYDQLKKLWVDGAVITLVLVLEVYPDVVITEVSAPRSGDSGDAIEFDISFAQIRRAKLDEVGLRLGVHPPKIEKKIQKQASVKKKGGDTGGAEATEDLENDVIDAPTLGIDYAGQS